MMSVRSHVAMFVILACGSVAAPTGLRGQPQANATTNSSASSVLLRSSSWPHPGCCNGCQTAFCSPNSGTCYDQKGKYYYLECATPTPGWANPGCCNGCQTAFCSPNSGTCYDQKGKDYYLECAAPANQPAPQYYYAGKQRCPVTSISSRLGSYDANTATECRMRCQSTPGCKVFDFSPANSPCGGGALCQLFSSWCEGSQENPCWEQYRLD